ncbi:MAG: tetratricopeptide repeat protein, partial [Bacilli bacterium]|nr:tetratricopeptide repeat protein [Bacilli bacterium]
VSKDTDICVCLDLDEVIEEGWREKLEKLWDKDTNRLAYNYIWSFDNYGNPAVNFYIEKIHDRYNYIWHHPVHEVLKYIGSEVENKKTTDDFTVKHYPDSSKLRSSYLPLLELSVKEDPLDDRNMHYLGREYMYYEKWNEAIDTLIKHLNLKSATWKEERSASMRYISRCYNKLNRIEEAKMWLEKAIIEAPYLREPYVEYAFLAQQLNDYDLVKDLLEKALLIKHRGKIYINENFCWDSTIYDLLSIAYFDLKDYDKALENVNKALELSNNDERIIENKRIIAEIKNKS